MDQCPRSGSLPRRISSTRPFSMTTPPTPTTGRSGYSRAKADFLSSELLAYTETQRKSHGIDFFRWGI